MIVLGDGHFNHLVHPYRKRFLDQGPNRGIIGRQLADLVREAWSTIVPKKVSRPVLEAARS